MKTSHLKIGSRLIISFSIVLMFLIIVTAVGVVQVGKINTSLTTISESNGVKQRYAINFRGSVHNRAIALRDAVMESDNAALKTQLDLISQLADAYTRSAAPLDNMFEQQTVTAEEKQALANIKAVEVRTLPLMDQVIKLRQAGQADEAKQVLLNQARPAFNDWLDSINVLIDLEEKMSMEQSVNARSIAGSFTVLMLILCGLAIAVGGLVAWLATRSIILPIQQASRVAKTVTTGDLTVQIHSQSGDETGQMLRSLGEMRDSLLYLVTNVRASTDNVASKAAEISADNLDLAARTGQQVASLEQTAANMRSLTETVKQNTQNARQANDLACSATTLADAGNEAMQTMVDTISKISGSSSKISDITGVIEGIAFQTNILALNAAVEAARAGEQGRGFAVVASEVRNLAQRSAAAAKEIKELIGASVTMITEGSQQAGTVYNAMEQIKQSVRSVSDIVAEISTASQEQSQGIEQATQTIAQMDQVTQQNASLVEHAASVAHSLEEQVSSLKQSISVFRLAGSTN